MSTCPGAPHPRTTMQGLINISIAGNVAPWHKRLKNKMGTLCFTFLLHSNCQCLRNITHRFFKVTVWSLVRFFEFFWKNLLCSARLHIFDQNYSKNCGIMKYYYNLKWLFLFEYTVKWFIPVMQSWIFSLQCHMIFQKSFCSRNISFYYQHYVENSCAVNIFMETLILFSRYVICWIESSKE